MTCHAEAPSALRVRGVGILGFVASGWLAAGRAICVSVAVLACVVPAPSAFGATDDCPNAEFRVGASAKLPDCRALELVTPANTGGLRPTAGVFPSIPHAFEAPLISTSLLGPSLIYNTVGGALSGTEGTGSTDRYEAIRDFDGWHTRLIGPTPAETNQPKPGGISADHGFYFLGQGASALPMSGALTAFGVSGGVNASFLRQPNGGFEPIGLGTLGVSPWAQGKYIAPGGAHVIFQTEDGVGGNAVQLEPMAAPSPHRVVYDRTIDGTTHVVSQLPGNLSTGSTDSNFQGSSLDGSTVLFSNPGPITGLGSTLYARVDNAESYGVAGSSALTSGSTLTCTAGPASATTRTFQWLRNGNPIGGATGSTYTSAPADAGAILQCQVFALNANAGSTQVSNRGVVVAPAPGTAVPVAPNNIAAPTPANPIAGTLETCAPGTWQGSPGFSYQWFVNGVAVPGAESNTYTVQAADVPGAIQCAVTGTNAGGSTTKVSANRNTSPAPSPAAPAATSTTNDARVTPAGLSGDGGHVFFVQAENVFSFDTATQEMTVVSDSGDAELVNISRDGSRVYFASAQMLDPPSGTVGQDNLYVWDRSSGEATFVATVDPADVMGDQNLVRWTSDAVAASKDWNVGAANATSRATPDGSVLVFESSAQLSAHDNAGHSEIYRYDAVADAIECASCGAGSSPSVADSSLQSLAGDVGDAIRPLTAVNPVLNVTDDGETVIFESFGRLVPDDSDARRDVYRWIDGEIELISVGSGAQDNYLYAMTPDGNDIFFLSGKALLPHDENGGTGAIYDARVNGGFASASSSTPPSCVDDACQGRIDVAPDSPGMASAGFSGSGNVSKGKKPKSKPRRCGKGHRRVKPGGKGRCIKRRSQSGRGPHRRGDHSGRRTNR